MESRFGIELSLSNAVGHVQNLPPNLVFGYAIGFRNAVVFEVVEGHPLNRVPFEFGGESIEPELNAVHGIESALGSARLVIEHQHAAALEPVNAIDAAVDHYILDRETEALLRGQYLRLGC